MFGWLSAKRIGRGWSDNLHEFTVPRSMTVRYSPDVDYGYWRIYFGPARNREFMEIMFGPLVGTAPPTEKWREASVPITR